MNHVDDHLDGGLADNFVMLIHAGVVSMIFSPFQLNKADVARDRQPHAFEPMSDNVIKSEDDVGFFLLKPFSEDTGIVAGFIDLIEGFGLPGFGQTLLGDVNAGGKAPVDQKIDLAVQNKSRALVAEGQGLLEGLEREDVLVGARE